MFKPKNLQVTSSKSGLVKKEILKTWFEENYFRQAKNKSLLVVDSLSTYRDQADILSGKPPKAKVEVRFIIN